MHKHRRRTFRKPIAGIVVALVALLLVGPSSRAGLIAPVLGPSTGSVSVVPTVDKLSTDLQEAVVSPAAEPVRVIVQTYAPPDSGELALTQLLGGAVKSTYTSIPGYSATVSPGSLLQIASDANVERVSIDAPVSAHMDIARRAVRADGAAALAGRWGAGLTGRGVGVAVIDTGVQGHPDLGRRIPGRQMVEVEIVGHEPGYADYFGHGTHVAGIVAGNGSASSDSLSFRTFKGVAPDARIISVRALNPDGTGYTSDILSAIDWVVRNARQYNIRVMNLSLGHPVFESYRTDPLCRAVAMAVRKGIVVVVAAGNDGTIGTGFGTITSPGNSPYAITVGAMDDFDTVPLDDDALAWYSSKGPSLVDFVVKPDLVAPGTWIVSARAVQSWLDTAHHELTLPIGAYRNDPEHAAEDGLYYSLSGTSMAAPMVAGAAALMLQKDPWLTPATVKARLMKSAVKDERLVFETGAGTLDVLGAVRATGTAQSAASPQAMAGDDGYIYIQDTALLWGSSWTQSAIWGGHKGAAYGVTMTPVPESITSGSGAIWGGGAGARSVIDNPEVTGEGAIWGGGRCSYTSTTGIVTGSGAIWGGSGRRL